MLATTIKANKYLELWKMSKALLKLLKAFYSPEFYVLSLKFPLRKHRTIMSNAENATAKHVDGVEDNRLVEAQQMSPDELLDAEKSLKRKLDIRLLLCVWVIFVMNYLDRVWPQLSKIRLGFN